jgi:hypothetical protein
MNRCMDTRRLAACHRLRVAGMHLAYMCIGGHESRIGDATDDACASGGLCKLIEGYSLASRSYEISESTREV